MEKETVVFVSPERAIELASKVKVVNDGVVFSEDLRMPDYGVSIAESVIYAYVCHCYKNKLHFSDTFIKKEFNVGYTYAEIDYCLKQLEKKGYIYRKTWYMPIYLPIYSKRYNEENPN